MPDWRDAVLLHMAAERKSSATVGPGFYLGEVRFTDRGVRVLLWGVSRILRQIKTLVRINLLQGPFFFFFL